MELCIVVVDIQHVMCVMKADFSHAASLISLSLLSIFCHPVDFYLLTPLFVFLFILGCLHFSFHLFNFIYFVFLFAFCA